MNRIAISNEQTSRREFLGGAAALAACAIVPGRVLGGESPPPAAAASGKPNSVFNGVRIGCITYSYRGGINSAEDTLKALIQDGLSEVELMGGPIQSYAGLGGGAPAAAKWSRGAAGEADRRPARGATGQVPGAAQDVQRCGR